MCTDLLSEEAIYHRACHRTFTHGKQLLTTDALGTTSSMGRPVEPHMSKLFDQMCDWLEVADEELYRPTLDELQERMITIGHSDEVYSLKQLKRKLVEKYDDNIFFSQEPGRINIICFRNMASRILTNKWYSEKEDNLNDESHRIVTATAKLIKAQIVMLH